MVTHTGQTSHTGRTVVTVGDVDADKLFRHFEWYNPRIEFGLRGAEYESRTFTKLFVNLLSVFEEHVQQKPELLTKAETQKAAQAALVQSVQVSFAQKLQQLQRGNQELSSLAAPTYGVDPTGGFEHKKPRVPKPPVKQDTEVSQCVDQPRLVSTLAQRKPPGQSRRDCSLNMTSGINETKNEIMSRSVEMNTRCGIVKKESCTSFIEFMKRTKEKSLVEFLKTKQRSSGVYQPPRLFSTEKYATEESKFEKLKFFLAASVEHAKVGSSRSGEFDIFSSKELGNTGVANLNNLHTGRSGRNHSSHEQTKEGINRKLNFNCSKEDALDSLRQGGGSSTNIPNSSTSRLKHIVSYREYSTQRSNYMGAGGIGNLDAGNHSISRMKLPLWSRPVCKQDADRSYSYRQGPVPNLNGLEQLSEAQEDTEQICSRVTGRGVSSGPNRYTGILNRVQPLRGVKQHTWTASELNMSRQMVTNQTNNSRIVMPKPETSAPRRGVSECGIRPITRTAPTQKLQDFVSIEEGAQLPAAYRLVRPYNSFYQSDNIERHNDTTVKAEELSFGETNQQQDRAEAMKRAGINWPSARLETDKQLANIVNVDRIPKIPKDLMKKLKKLVDSKKQKQYS